MRSEVLIALPMGLNLECDALPISKYLPIFLGSVKHLFSGSKNIKKSSQITT